VLQVTAFKIHQYTGPHCATHIFPLLLQSEGQVRIICTVVNPEQSLNSFLWQFKPVDDHYMQFVLSGQGGQTVNTKKG